VIKAGFISQILFMYVNGVFVILPTFPLGMKYLHLVLYVAVGNEKVLWDDKSVFC